MKLKPFGKGGSTYKNGYTLSVLIGHIEALISDEEELPQGSKRAERLEKVERAVSLLNESDEE